MSATHLYDKVSHLPTDEYWVFALIALRSSEYYWKADELQYLLNSLRYLRSDESPYTLSYIKTCLLLFTKEGLLKKISNRARYGAYNSVSVVPEAARVMRQHLLQYFPQELEECCLMLKKQFSSFSGELKYSYPKLSAEEKKFLNLFQNTSERVEAMLFAVTAVDQKKVHKHAPLAKLCGVMSYSKDSLLNATTFLPPYPEKFLAEIPVASLEGIVRSFAQRPLLFPVDIHADLYHIAQTFVQTKPQLVEDIAFQWLPGTPTEKLARELPSENLRVVHSWITGQAQPEDDTPASLKASYCPSIPWVLRALLQFNRKQITAKEVMQPLNKAPEFLRHFAQKIMAPESISVAELQEESFPGAFSELLLLLLAVIWTGEEVELQNIDDIMQRISGPASKQMPWLRGQIANAISRVQYSEDQKYWQGYADQLKGTHNFHYFDGLIEPPPVWEKLLLSLESNDLLEGTTGPGGTRKGELRIAYFYDAQKQSLSIKEQKYGKKGWTPGRKIDWRKFLQMDLPDRDEKTFKALRNYSGNPINLNKSYYDWENQVYSIDIPHALFLLADHPHVFEDDKKRTPLTIEKGEPQLLVEHDEQGNLDVRFEPGGLTPGYNVKRTAPSRLSVYHLTDELHNIARRIPPEGISVPAFAADRLDKVLPKLRSEVTVHSTTDWMDAGLEEVKGQSKPCFHIFPLGSNGHRIEIYIKPIPEASYYYRPGEGLSRILIATEVAGRQILARDLNAEIAAVQICLDANPALGEHNWASWEILLEDDQKTLELLFALRDLDQKGLATIEYPKGQRIKLGSSVDEEQLKVAVSSGRDWFRVEAGLQIDENRVIDYEMILEGLRNGDKFIRVGEEEFLTLTDQLRDRLQKMDGLLHKNRGHQELPPLAAEAFAQALEGLQDVAFDTAWAANLERIAEAKAFTPPPPPASFLADLRPYQQLGYEWLLRVANWGAGACLADDMGLGKTIQALAILSHRAPGGPALVIAPASVIRNWRTETDRFAPSLRPILIGSAAEAPIILDQLEAGDVALLSFGLLPYIADQLLGRSYHTLVVDEAQAIKNATTQRARAVRDLEANFKMATTGTPIENNLGELWSLFRFLNPGLFGSNQRFRKQYENPIVKYEDKGRAEQLRQIVRPFILRRRKDEVLKELPPKTEIVRTVEPSVEEQSLYEALRRKALREIEQADQQKRRFLVLQQLTKLRQAACHPKLVRPNSKISSAKLEAVGETIKEIVEGGHKALIFSQFVRHLKLVEEWVKNEDIDYKYLDGSTPGKKRQERVEAFQAGQGKLFLISLKAGGTGLNLTAADYVLHLDPWWNPAAEDQASDRAHRIGQTRSVTVYRFVTAGTIEEQIIELHASKRDLADKLLSGADGAGQLSVDEVVELLRAAPVE